MKMLRLELTLLVPFSLGFFNEVSTNAFFFFVSWGFFAAAVKVFTGTPPRTTRWLCTDPLMTFWPVLCMFLDSGGRPGPLFSLTDVSFLFETLAVTWLLNECAPVLRVSICRRDKQNYIFNTVINTKHFIFHQTDTIQKYVADLDNFSVILINGFIFSGCHTF